MLFNKIFIALIHTPFPYSIQIPQGNIDLTNGFCEILWWGSFWENGVQSRESEWLCWGPQYWGHALWKPHCFSGQQHRSELASWALCTLSTCTSPTLNINGKGGLLSSLVLVYKSGFVWKAESYRDVRITQKTIFQNLLLPPIRRIGIWGRQEHRHVDLTVSL